jgi:hypothetical protein
MSLQIQLHSIRCLNESSEASASDEAYVIVAGAGLRPPFAGLPIPALPNQQVVSYGIFTDMDDDDEAPVIVDGRPFWGFDGTPRDILDPSDVAFVVSVMEQDNGTPAQYVELVNVKMGLSLTASAGDPDPRSRAARLATDISNVLNAIDVPIPFAFDDDHIATQLLPLDAGDLAAGPPRDRRMVFSGDGAEYELIIRVSHTGWEHNVPSTVPAAPGTSPTTWFTPTDNVQHIAYAGADGAVQEAFFRLGGAGWEHNVPSAGQVAVAPGTSPTAWFTPSENIQHIAYVGADGAIHEAFFRIGGGGGWEHNVPSTVPAAPNTSPTSWFTPGENIQHIAYAGADGAVHEAFFRIGGTAGWEHNVPSAGQMGIAPGTSPTAWFTPGENIQHIAYVGADGAVHEAFFRIGGGGGWEHNVPSTVPAAPGTSPVAWFTPTDNVQHIAYAGADGAVHEAFFRIGGTAGWEHNVPSAGQMGIAPGTSPTAWFTPGENIQHIAYVGADGAIHEAFFRIGGGGGWEHNVPSTVPAAPNTSPSAWFTPGENIQHIAYVAADGAIHEAFFRLV